MRKQKVRSKLLWTAAIGCMLTLPPVISASIAQPGGQRGFRGGHDRHGARGMMRELDLSEEQREQMRALREQTSGETRRRVREAREALNEAVDDGQDEGALRQLGYDLGMAEGDAAVERARVQAQVMQILTDEQRQTLQALKQERKQEMQERRERFEERRRNRRDRQNPDSF